MKENWTRSEPPIALDRQAVASLLGCKLSSCEPLGGGLINTNIKVVRSDGMRVVLRLYHRGATEALREAAVLRHIAQKVPVARVLHVAPDNPVTGHAYAVLEWVDGTRLSEVSPVGETVGTVLAAIHGFTFDRAGFFDADLTVSHAIDLTASGINTFLREALIEQPGGVRLGTELTKELLDFAERQGERLAPWLDPPCLVHGDFNGFNILMRDTEIAAVLDWEFALSASPAFDFGNLLRPPLGARPEFMDAVVGAYRHAGGRLPPDWRARSRFLDLTAWADILRRPHLGPEIVADARRMVADIIRNVGG
jgi:aminoglycoside phosphotransferase (APT) family kinase protein